jgi:integrase
MPPRKPKRRRGFGAGAIRKRGDRWQIAWREHGRRRYTAAPDEETAKRMLAKILSDVALGRVGLEPEKKGTATLAELAEEWLERRKKNGKHRSAPDDASRWRMHLLPRFGKLRPDEVTPRLIRDMVEAKLDAGLNSATCKRITSLLSTFYTDLCERKLAQVNPAKGLPKATRELLKSSHDPKTTPFVEKLADVERIYRALPEPVNLAYAIGSMAGLRTGEILALQWSSVDLERRRIVVSEQVQDGVVMRPKDKDSRVVPIWDSLLPVLKAWHLRSGGQGQVVPPMRGGSRKRLDPHTLGKCLREAFEAINKEGHALPRMTWYQATRHTFASQAVMNGVSIEKLREAMGHSSVVVTERYAHLRGDVFTTADLGRVAVDFSSPVGKILPLVRTDSGTLGAGLVSEGDKSQIAS